MAVTIEQLRTEVTSEDALEDVIDILDAQDFTSTSWQTGSDAHAWMMTLAECFKVFHNETVIPIVESVHNETATGYALRQHSKNVYDNTPVDAVATQGAMTLTDADSTGPHTIAVGELVVEDEFGTTYRNLTGGTLTLGSTLTLSWQAEIAGTRGNIANGSTLALNTSISGVTVDNDNSDGTSWITRAGVDIQSNKILREINRTKWATLSPNGPSSAYKHWALTATDGSGDPIGLTKAFVAPPDGNGAFNIYVGNDTATATAGQVSDLQAFIDERKSPSAIPTAVAATEVAITFSATVTIVRGTITQCTTELNLALEDYINSVDVGGDKVDDTAFGYVLLARLVDVAMDVDNVLNFVTTFTDQQIQNDEQPIVGTITLNFTEI